MPRVATVLLLVDFLNFMNFDSAKALAPDALRAARRARELKRRLARSRVPVIYANDNFGHWESDIHAIVQTCVARGGASRKLAEMMAPERGDHSVLKPRHSAFFGTPLEFLLKDLGAGRLVVTGLTTDSCVMFTAHDAYVRGYKLWIPSDCVAAARPQYTRASLEHMRRVLKASTVRSTTPTTTAFKSGAS